MCIICTWQEAGLLLKFSILAPDSQALRVSTTWSSATLNGVTNSYESTRVNETVV